MTRKQKKRELLLLWIANITAIQAGKIVVGKR